MTRDEAIASMKNDIVQAHARGFEGWGDEIILEIQGKEWTPNQLVVEAENHTAVGLEFLDTIYIPNKEEISQAPLSSEELAAIQKELAEVMGVDPSQITVVEGDQDALIALLDEDEEEASETTRTLH